MLIKLAKLFLLPQPARQHHHPLHEKILETRIGARSHAVRSSFLSQPAAHARAFLSVSFFLISFFAPSVVNNAKPQEKGSQGPVSAKESQTQTSSDKADRGVALPDGERGKIADSGESAKKESVAPAAGARPRRITRDGVVIEFEAQPLVKRSGTTAAAAAELMEGEEAVVRFSIADAATGTPMRGLRPTAWLDLKRAGPKGEAKQCREKVQSFVQGSLRTRPDVDLNTYYVLTLNEEPNISVIDPLLGYGNSKLYTLVPLKSSGADWILSKDQKRLYVTMPLINQVAVVDTMTWKVTAHVDVGLKPTRIVLQKDGKYVWVAGEAQEQSTVTAIDTATLAEAARIAIGDGPHEMALAEGDRRLFVTNKRGGTLSVIDVQELKKVGDIKTGNLPTSLAYSALGKAIYVSHEGDGAVVAIDGDGVRMSASIKASEGIGAIRFTPDGRWGFVVNGKNNTVHIFDASINQMLPAIEVGKGPNQITFTSAFAYIRSTGSEQISMIRLNALGKDSNLTAIKFPAGQNPPEDNAHQILADAVTTAPEGNAVLVANPADKIIYYYTEGMAAPMGNFQNYRRAPQAVLVVDRSLREVAPGVYSTNAKMAAEGNYDVALLLDAPRIVECFDLGVQANSALKGNERRATFRAQLLRRANTISAGATVKLQFKLIDQRTKEPRAGIKDVNVLTLLAPGVWQKRQAAVALDDGAYEVEFVPPQSGTYYVFFESFSLGFRYNQLPFSVLQVAAAPSSSTPSPPAAAAGTLDKQAPGGPQKQ